MGAAEGGRPWVVGFSAKCCGSMRWYGRAPPFFVSPPSVVCRSSGLSARALTDVLNVWRGRLSLGLCGDCGWALSVFYRCSNVVVASAHMLGFGEGASSDFVMASAHQLGFCGEGASSDFVALVKGMGSCLLGRQARTSGGAWVLKRTGAVSW